MNKISSFSYYSNYYGHKTDHLKLLIPFLRKRSKGLIFLAGDSSNDNKHWIRYEQMVDSVNGYEHILDPPKSYSDITYHLNKCLEEKRIKYCAVNCAVEEASLGEKKYKLTSQDRIIQENISENDILIVSIGGNDIALKPSLSTIWNIIKMLYLNETSVIKNYPSSVWGLPYFIDMFGASTEDYILKLINGKKPKKIIINMIYYPDERKTGSWADRVLGYLGYNDDPIKLQTAIKTIFEQATSKINIDNIEVIPFASFKILDGKTSSDYVQRVEPSSEGGKKIAQAWIKELNL